MEPIFHRVNEDFGSRRNDLAGGFLSHGYGGKPHDQEQSQQKRFHNLLLVVPIFDLLVDVFGDRFACALLSANGVRLVHGVSKYDVTSLQVHNLYAGSFIGLLGTEEQHFCPACPVGIGNAGEFIVGFTSIGNYNDWNLFLLDTGRDVGFESV
jgi:hypothetical protein